ncbi:MAG: hypothetical protein Q7S10_02825, partial [bacterium]|nr:hypothetical protein [bacterium]
KTISLKGWTLKNADGKISIPLKGQIPAQGFYLLERTDDNSVANIKADIIYRGSLRNSGDSLQLSAGANALVDSVAFASSWPAGNNETKQTMEKTAEGLPAQAGWQTSKDAGGTPKAANSIVIALKKENENANTIISKNAPAMLSGSSSNPWLLFLTALAVALVGGTAILFLKLKNVKKQNIL